MAGETIAAQVEEMDGSAPAEPESPLAAFAR